MSADNSTSQEISFLVVLDLLKVLSCNETIEEMKLDGNKNIDPEILSEIEQELACDSSSDEEDEQSYDESGSDYSSDEDVSKEVEAEKSPRTMNVGDR
jgi:hypothetical protein